MLHLAYEICEIKSHTKISATTVFKWTGKIEYVIFLIPLCLWMDSNHGMVKQSWLEYEPIDPHVHLLFIRHLFSFFFSFFFLFCKARFGKWLGVAVRHNKPTGNRRQTKHKIHHAKFWTFSLHFGALSSGAHQSCTYWSSSLTSQHTFLSCSTDVGS